MTTLIERAATFYTGRKLLIAAWIVEIFAALVGLSIAVMTGYAIYEELSLESGMTLGSIYTNVLLGALPFLMVSVVELTKIPLAIAFYSSAVLVWRLVFGISLVFLMFITFETALNGFERNFNNLTYTIQQKTRELIGIGEQAAAVDQQVSNRSGLTADSVQATFRARAEELDRARQADLAEIEKLVQDKHRISNTPVAANSSDLANSQIDELRADHQRRLDQLERDNRASIDRVEKEAKAERTTHEMQLSQIADQVRDLQRQEEKELAAADFLTSKAGIAERFERRRAPLLAQQKTLADRLSNVSTAAQLERLRSEYTRAVGEENGRFTTRLNELQQERKNSSNRLAERDALQRRGLENELKGLDGQKQAILQKYTALQAANEKQREDAQRDSKENAHVIAALTASREDLERKRSDLRDFINRKVADNQVYRITALWTGRDNAADIRRDELRMTAIVWFGSLAAIVAATGTIIAFAGLVLMYPREKSRPLREALPAAINRLAVQLRILIRRRNRKVVPKVETRFVEVVKEVPVERVVFRDVPREVVRREIVHVPLYTADQELLTDQKQHA